MNFYNSIQEIEKTWEKHGFELHDVQGQDPSTGLYEGWIVFSHKGKDLEITWTDYENLYYTHTFKTGGNLIPKYAIISLAKEIEL